MKSNKIKKLIDTIYEKIESKLDNSRGIKTLEIDYHIDGGNDPVIKFKLETYSKI